MVHTYFPEYSLNEAISYLEGLGYQIDYHAAGGYVVTDPEQLQGAVMRNDIDLIRYVQGMDIGSALTEADDV